MNKPESLPWDEHRQVVKAFFRVVSPEIRPVAHNALCSMLAMGTLRNSSASRLLSEFWATPEMREARLAWQAEDDAP